MDCRNRHNGGDVRVGATLVATMQQAMGTAGVLGIHLPLGIGFVLELHMAQRRKHMAELVHLAH